MPHMLSAEIVAGEDREGGSGAKVSNAQPKAVSESAKHRNSQIEQYALSTRHTQSIHV